MEPSMVAVIKHDGMEYTLDVLNLNGRELGVIKREVVGILGMYDVLKHIGAADQELYAVLLGIAMQRQGADNVNFAGLKELPTGAIRLDMPNDAERPTPAGE